MTMLITLALARSRQGVHPQRDMTMLGTPASRENSTGCKSINRDTPIINTIFDKIAFVFCYHIAANIYLNNVVLTRDI